MAEDKGVQVEVDSKDFQLAMDRLPRYIQNSLIRAGAEIGPMVLKTEGLQSYPPPPPSSRPPTPYYQRGLGYIRADGTVDARSEQYGKQWNTRVQPYRVTLGNRSSYAPFLADEHRQASGMRRIGWRKLINVVRDKMGLIKRIYNAWIGKAIQQAGFRLK